jgi:hypothetical protein
MLPALVQAHRANWQRITREMNMLRRVARASCFFALIFVASFVLAQTEFSADIVDLQKPGAPATSKMYFAKDKLRIEQNTGAGAKSALIINLATQTSTVLMAHRQMYVEMPAQSQAQRHAFAFFKVGDLENACGEWQNMADNKGGSCHKVSSENVNGRNTIKYEATSTSGSVTHFWLDSQLRFPVKWQSKGSNEEMRNVQEGPQPASLFEIPGGYTKMDLGPTMPQPH